MQQCLEKWLLELPFGFAGAIEFCTQGRSSCFHTRLRLHASPRSLCALRAVDKSVLLMKPENELSPSSVSLGYFWQ